MVTDNIQQQLFRNHFNSYCKKQMKSMKLNTVIMDGLSVQTVTTDGNCYHRWKLLPQMFVPKSHYAASGKISLSCITELPTATVGQVRVNELYLFYIFLTTTNIH
jgi:hypothetical protein